MEYHDEDEEYMLNGKMDPPTMMSSRSLKEVLKRQRQAQMICDAKYWEKAFALQKFIDQELEIHVGIAQARKKLHEKFKEYTTHLNKQIMINRKNSHPTSKAGLASIRNKSLHIEVELNRRSSEISELQRDIHTAEQDTKSRAQWNNIDTVFEAKFAIKYIFKQLIDTKRTLQTQIEQHSIQHEELKQSYEIIKAENDKIKTELATTTQQYDLKLTKAAKQRDVDISIIQRKRKQNDMLENKNKNLASELENVIEQISSFRKMADNVVTAAINTLDEESIQGMRNGESNRDEDKSGVENSPFKHIQEENEKANRRNKRNAPVETPAKIPNNSKDVSEITNRDKVMEWNAKLITNKEQPQTINSSTTTENSTASESNTTVLSQRNNFPKMQQHFNSISRSEMATSTQSVTSGTVCTCKGICSPTNCRCLLAELGCGVACFCPCLNHKARQRKSKRCFAF